jgi:hypothetical protein
LSAGPEERALHESRFWVVARRPGARSLPYGWSNFLSIAVLLARCVRRCGLEAVRVVDSWTPTVPGPKVVWDAEDEDRATLAER